MEKSKIAITVGVAAVGVIGLAVLIWAMQKPPEPPPGGDDFGAQITGVTYSAV